MTVAQQVANILSASRAARNSEKELYIIYFQKFGMELTPKQIQLIREMPIFETIRRERQKLQASGKFPADPHVKQARKDKASRVRQHIRYTSPEALLEQRGYHVLPFGEG